MTLKQKKQPIDNMSIIRVIVVHFFVCISAMFMVQVLGGVERLILVRMTWLGALDTTHVRALEFATNCVPFLLLNIQMKDVEEENGHCQKKVSKKC